MQQQPVNVFFAPGTRRSRRIIGKGNRRGSMRREHRRRTGTVFPDEVRDKREKQDRDEQRQQGKHSHFKSKNTILQAL
jgi:hypothetical protein